MAHVQKKGARWQARYRDQAGKEHTQRFDRKLDADRWLVDEQAKIAAGGWTDPAARKISLADYAATWMTRMRPTWRVSTAAGVANSLDHHVLPVLGRRPVASLRKPDVEAMCASLALAPSTVATVHQHLEQLLAGAVEDGLIARNPATRARLQSARRRRRSQSRSRPWRGSRPAYRSGWQ